MILSRRFFLIFAILCAGYLHSHAQVADTLFVKKSEVNDSALTSIANPILKENKTQKQLNPNYRSPRTAALRSAILPGLGQVYNKKYWKVPIVYVVLGGTAWYFFGNLKLYNEYKRGYTIAVRMHSTVKDSTGYNDITNQYIKYAVDNNYQSSLRYARDSYRKDVDYAAVYFLIGWILNVVDATVDAHLHSFDISPNLSLNIRPGPSKLARTNGLSLVLNFK